MSNTVTRKVATRSPINKSLTPHEIQDNLLGIQSGTTQVSQDLGIARTYSLTSDDRLGLLAIESELQNNMKLAASNGHIGQYLNIIADLLIELASLQWYRLAPKTDLQILNNQIAGIRPGIFRHLPGKNPDWNNNLESVASSAMASIDFFIKRLTTTPVSTNYKVQELIQNLNSLKGKLNNIVRLSDYNHSPVAFSHQNLDLANIGLVGHKPVLTGFELSSYGPLYYDLTSVIAQLVVSQQLHDSNPNYGSLVAEKLLKEFINRAKIQKITIAKFNEVFIALLAINVLRYIAEVISSGMPERDITGNISIGNYLSVAVPKIADFFAMIENLET